MILPIDLYALGKGVVVQHTGLSENWFRHFNRAIERKFPNRIGGRSINRRKTLGELRAGIDLDGGNEHFQNAVIQFQLIGGIMPCMDQEKIGHPTQHVCSFDRSGRDCVLKFGDEIVRQQWAYSDLHRYETDGRLPYKRIVNSTVTRRPNEQLTQMTVLRAFASRREKRSLA